MRSLTASSAALILAAGLAAAQPAGGAKPADGPPEAAAQKAQLKRLDEAERAETKAVWQDKKLSKTDKESSLRRVHAEYKRKKDALRTQMKAERKARRAERAADKRQPRERKGAK